MNLIQDSWLPVLRLKGGIRSRIRPAELVSEINTNPVVALDTGRADLNSALTQFLIGLLQTTLEPEGDQGWAEQLAEPPEVESLQAAFDAVQEAFKLTGNAPRFMQENGLQNREVKAVGTLFLDAKGEDGSMFVKTGTIGALCPACSAAALYTLMAFAPPGGRGHMTGLRGGGPLTTLVQGRNLWETCWLGVLPTVAFRAENQCDVNLNGIADRFPWMGALRTSENGQVTFPRNIHPHQVHWTLPRRIWLNFEEVEAGVCDLCGSASGLLATGYHDSPQGIKYSGEFRHPLTPYYKSKDSKSGQISYLPLHGQPGGLGYDRWIGLILGKKDDSRVPAAVVRRYANQVHRYRLFPELKHLGKSRLWVSGYDMDNMKPRGYVESTVPLVIPDGERAQEILRNFLEAAANGADLARSYLVGALKEAGTAAAQASKVNADRAFWREGEERFTRLLHEAIGQLGKGDWTKAETRLLTDWRNTLIGQINGLFDRFVFSASPEEANPARVFKAQKALRKNLWGAKLRNELNLPEPEKPKRRANS